MKARVGSIFAGIGGFDLGFERAGFEIAWQVEADPFCLDLLRRRFPKAERFNDVTTFRPRERDARSIDVLVGGPPCQPISFAGNRLGEADDRWLWPDALRILEESGAPVAVFENPLGFRTLGMAGVLARLAELGFDATWASLRASDFGAPHRRARIFIIAADPDRSRVRIESWWDEFERSESAVAFADREAGSGEPTDAVRAGLAQRNARGTEELAVPLRCCVDTADTDGDRLAAEWFEEYFQQRGAPGFVSDRRRQWGRWSRTIGYCDGAPFPVVRGMDDEFPGRVDRLRALGNAVAPLLAQRIAEHLLRATIEPATRSEAKS